MRLDSLTPREIVAELDRFIVAQNAAKRAVAVALRNRWRRQQLDPSLREEVAPKNIIMIGPTGVGKTEIARRLSKLTGWATHRSGLAAGAEDPLTATVRDYLVPLWYGLWYDAGSAAEVVRESLQIASSIDIYTNDHITIEELSS